ncbi:hypothetical protein LTSEMIN_2014, partial [Salmonella enterica subsp. enterica serovar Minnesota str. A4-603]
MQTVVKRVIGNLEAKFNDNFAKALFITRLFV